GGAPLQVEAHDLVARRAEHGGAGLDGDAPVGGRGGGRHGPQLRWGRGAGALPAGSGLAAAVAEMEAMKADGRDRTERYAFCARAHVDSRQDADRVVVPDAGHHVRNDRADVVLPLMDAFFQRTRGGGPHRRGRATRAWWWP